jgi:hypothetical protein
MTNNCDGDMSRETAMMIGLRDWRCFYNTRIVIMVIRLLGRFYIMMIMIDEGNIQVI